MTRWGSRSKYGATKVEFEGEIFHSKGELGRWCDLRLLEKAKAISNLKRQVKFPLLVGLIKIGDFIADFTYDENDKPCVEDWKGVWTPLARWKVKHFEAQYGMDVRITGAAAK